MAASPFATSGNVADIAPVQLRGGFTPNTGIADAVVNVANLAIPLITKAHEDELVDDVSGRIKAVSLALKATRFPSIQDSIFSEEALANPQVALALKEFTLIQDAATKGRLPQTFALERLELIQNNAIRNAPEFEAEIRGAMRDATGQDPQKTLFQQLISTTSGKTAQQKLDEQLFIEAGKQGITVEKLIAINHSVAQNQIQQQQYDLAAKQGTYDLNTLSKDVAIKSATIITDIMSTVNKTLVGGGSIGVNEKRNLITQVNAAYGVASAQIMANVNGVNVSGTAVQAELAPLNAMRDNTIAMIEDNTMQTMLSQHNKVIVDSTVSNVLHNEQFGGIYALAGERGLLDWMKWMGKAGGTAEGKALVASLNADAKIGFELNNIGKAYTEIGGAVEPETKQAKQERVIAAGIALATQGIPEEFQITALEEIKKFGGEELAWSSFNSNKVLTATATSNKLKAAFINMQVTTTAGLSSELLNLAADPELPLERLELNQADQLHIKPQSGFGTVGRDARLAEGRLQTFVDRFNRANSISAKYNGAGILPSARYQGAAQYWEIVKSAASAAVAPKEKTSAPRTVVRDSDGNLSFSDGS
jgi:hypothetical protein